MRRSLISITVPTGSVDFERRRGRVRGWWIAVPVALLWTVALAVSLSVGLRHQPDLAPFTAVLYVCAAFFVHAYTVAWRAGAFVWRYAALFAAVAFFSVLAFLHADDAGARIVYAGGVATSRPPEPLLFVAVSMDVIAALLLLLHGLFLGLGARRLTARELRSLTTQTADDNRR